MDDHSWYEVWSREPEKFAWYSADLQSDFEQTHHDLLDSLQPDIPCNDQSFEIHGMSTWPPSLIAAVESGDTQPIQTEGIPTSDGKCSEITPPSEEHNEIAAVVPFSFQHRMLQLSGPLHDTGMEPFFAGCSLPYRHRSDQPTNSVTMALDNMFDSTDEGSAAYSRCGTSSVAEQHGSIDPSISLQHHWIRTADGVERASMPEARDPDEHEHQRNMRSPSENAGARTLRCSLCPDKKFTGNWALGNLRRHRRQEHSASSSAEGSKTIRCSVKNCDSTFSRDDARLVHERRSHPELDRPPPNKKANKKRKRYDDL